MYLSLGGRIGRRDYWLYSALPLGVLGLLTAQLELFTGSPFEEALGALLLWPAIAVQAKRWHDQDFSGWWVLVNLIPVAGSLVGLLCNGFVRGTSGENQYGPDPLEERG